MHLLEVDVWKLVSPIPYLALAKHSSAKRYLAALVRDGGELENILQQFPDVQYQALDQHYALLRCLGALSEELVTDLCTHYTWRGFVLACFLVALAPDSKSKDYLTEARPRAPQNLWIIDLAIAEIEGVTWLTDPETQNLIRKLRVILSPTLAPLPRLRRFPNTVQLAEIATQREAVRSAYLAGGLEEALRVARGSEALQAVQEGGTRHR